MRSYKAFSARDSSYEIQFDERPLNVSLSKISEWIGESDSLIVTTPSVDKYFGSLIKQILNERSSYHILQCRESNKDLEQVQKLCHYAQEINLSRNGVIIGVGGGVCTDIATVAASWIRRGIKHIRVPSTLVGLVDAGIGYKGAINIGSSKSYLGCFHAPYNVLLCPQFLHTLDDNHIRNGFAEIVKIAITSDARLFNQVENYGEQLIHSKFQSSLEQGSEIIWRAAFNMMEELKNNPFEDKTFERLVDFGHTFSPLIESISSYDISHGEAVSIDIALSAVVSTELGLMNSSLRDSVLGVLSSLGLPVYSHYLSPSLCEKSLRYAALHRGGEPNLVLPVELEQSKFIKSDNDISNAVFANSISLLKDFHNSICPRKRMSA